MSRRNSRDLELRERAEKVIPGGMFGHQSVRLLPEGYPQFFSRAKGSRIWDADGTEYLDFMCAYGPNLMGYADPEIDAAYIGQLGLGDTLTGPTALLVELAEAMIAMVSHAAWMIPCKNGSDATLIALMAARAHTRRRTVILARGAYHGCHPWSAQRRSGTLPEEKAHQIFCDYNDAASLEEAARQAGEDLAAIFAAPLKHDAFIDQALPDPAYAATARRICDETGAMLVVDDVRAGLRLARDCSWSLVGVEPDLSCWGKCVANGHALSAVLGSEKVRGAAERIFVTGSFWCEAAPMAAALATLKRVRETAYLEHMQSLGEQLRVGLADLADRHGVGLRQSGPATMPLFLFDEDRDMRRGFFFASEMLRRGIYTHPWHNMFFCSALTVADIDMTLEAADGALEALKANLGRLEPVEKMAFLAA